MISIDFQLNPGQVCFYRVNYSSEMLDALIPAIHNQSMSPIDRLGIQNDLFALVSFSIPFICVPLSMLGLFTALSLTVNTLERYNELIRF